jgi:hypothetical protein
MCRVDQASQQHRTSEIDEQPPFHVGFEASPVAVFTVLYGTPVALHPYSDSNAVAISPPNTTYQAPSTLTC